MVLYGDDYSKVIAIARRKYGEVGMDLVHDVLIEAEDWEEAPRDPVGRVLRYVHRRWIDDCRKQQRMVSLEQPKGEDLTLGDLLAARGGEGGDRLVGLETRAREVLGLVRKRLSGKRSLLDVYLHMERMAAQRGRDVIGAYALMYDLTHSPAGERRDGGDVDELCRLLAWNFAKRNNLRQYLRRIGLVMDEIHARMSPA